MIEYGNRKGNIRGLFAPSGRYSEGILSKMPLGTIKIRIPTRRRLVDIGKKSETYDDVINRMIDEHEDLQRHTGVREQSDSITFSRGTPKSS